MAERKALKITSKFDPLNRIAEICSPALYCVCAQGVQDPRLPPRVRRGGRGEPGGGSAEAAGAPVPGAPHGFEPPPLPPQVHPDDLPHSAPADPYGRPPCPAGFLC